MLLKLPLDLLYVILDFLPENDHLWKLWNTSKSLRPYVAERLFRQLDVFLQPTSTLSLNGRTLQAREISTILRSMSSEIQKVNLGCRGCDLPMSFGNLAVSKNFPTQIVQRNQQGHMQQLSSKNQVPLRNTVLHTPLSLGIYCPSFWLLRELEIRSQSAGCLTFPHLPSLTFLSIDFDSQVSRSHHCSVLVNLENFPQLSQLEVTWLENDNLAIYGSTESLRSFVLNHSIAGTRFASMISNMSASLDEIRINRSILLFPWVPCSPRVKLSNLKRLELDDSIGFLPFLFADEIPKSMEEATISIGDQDSIEFGNIVAKLLILVAGEKEIIRITDGERAFALIKHILSFLNQEAR